MQLFQLHLLGVNLNAMDFNLKACLLVLISILTVGFFSISEAQIKANSIVVSDSLYHAEVSCGTCMFKMKGSGCDLAVKINGHCYVVQGTGIDDYGDAHAANGFCNAIRKARVWGSFKKEVFVAQKIELIKED
jgi:hypothetical protein